MTTHEDKAWERLVRQYDTREDHEWKLMATHEEQAVRACKTTNYNARRQGMRDRGQDIEWHMKVGHERKCNEKAWERKQDSERNRSKTMHKKGRDNIWNEATKQRQDNTFQCKIGLEKTEQDMDRQDNDKTGQGKARQG